MKAKIIFWGWIATILALFLYSFTQIDLGLTLTRASFWQPIQKYFQHIGYFNRPLSAGLYLSITILLFLFYFLILAGSKKNWFSFRQIWKLIFITAGILWFSYNAFSHDLFNYIFDARILTYYHQNPYNHKALDFPGDPMLGFMHWTHRLFPYGPAWLGFTLFTSYLGFQKLIPTMLLFKGLSILSYLGSCFLIGKILGQTGQKNRLLAVSFFAFSPLIIIEGLVSAHNDIFMMFLALLSLWFLLKRKRARAYLFFALSVGIKFATIFLLPVFLFVEAKRHLKSKIDWQKVWFYCLILMIPSIVLASIRTVFQPWYIFYVFPFAALISQKRIIFLLVISVSLSLTFVYLPFLYLGNWDPPVPAIKNFLVYLGVFLGFFIYFIETVVKKINK